MDWPSSLPQDFKSGTVRCSIVDNKLVTEMEVGPPKKRLRSTVEHRLISGELPPLTQEQFDTLMAFWRNDAGQGTIPFTWGRKSIGKVHTYEFESDPECTQGAKYDVRLKLKRIA